MAEAAVDKQTNAQLLKYFCHQCTNSVEIKASTDATNLTCPRCESSFIEELTQELENDHLQTDGAYDQETLSFLRNSNPSRLLSSMILSLGSVNHGEDNDDDTDDDDGDDGYYHILGGQGLFSSSSQSGSTSASTSTSASSRSSQQSPFHRFLEQLLGNLRAENLGSDQSVNFLPGFAPLLQGFHGDPRDYAWGADGIDNIITQLLNQTEGAGPPPATKEDIDTLPTASISQDCVDQGIQCSVCLENFIVEESVRCLPCEHLFHNDCVVPWLQLHRTCPICRKPVGGEANGDDPPPAPPPPPPRLQRELDGQHHRTSSHASSSENYMFHDADEAATMEAVHLPTTDSYLENLWDDMDSNSDMET